MSSFQKQLVTASQRAVQPSHLVEFVVPQISLQQLALIFPLLGHLSFSDDPRWLTCIGSLFLSKKDCLQFGLNRHRLLQVLPGRRCNSVDIAERALLTGKSHKVVCVAEEISDQELLQLERAAETQRCRCIVIRSR
jgi:cell division inhibitor SulA